MKRYRYVIGDQPEPIESRLYLLMSDLQIKLLRQSPRRGERRSEYKVPASIAPPSQGTCSFICENEMCCWGHPWRSLPPSLFASSSPTLIHSHSLPQDPTSNSPTPPPPIPHTQGRVKLIHRAPLLSCSLSLPPLHLLTLTYNVLLFLLSHVGCCIARSFTPPNPTFSPPCGDLI